MKAVCEGCNGRGGRYIVDPENMCSRKDGRCVCSGCCMEAGFGERRIDDGGGSTRGGGKEAFARESDQEWPVERME